MHAHLSPLHCHYKGMARSDQINSYPGGGTQNFNFDIEFTKMLRVVIINLNFKKWEWTSRKWRRETRWCDNANIIRWLIGFVSNQSTNRSRTTSFNIMFSHSQSKYRQTSECSVRDRQLNGIDTIHEKVHYFEHTVEPRSYKSLYFFILVKKELW